MQCLVARFNGQLLRYPLPRIEVSLGSAPSNDIRLPFPGVSRKHALLTPTGDGLVIRDAGSKNRLFIGDQRVDEVQLSPGVAVQIGRAFLSIEDHSTSDFEVGVALPAESHRSGSEGGETDSSSSAPSERSAIRFIRGLELAGKRRIRRELQAWMKSARDVLQAQSLLLLHDEGVVAASGPFPSDALIDRIGASIQLDRKPQPSATRVLMDRTILTARTPGRGRIGCLAAVFRESAESIQQWRRDLFELTARKFLDIDEPFDSDAAPESQLKIPPGMVIGHSQAMENLLAQVGATVGSRMDVLLWGETGTGKELFARMIHACGPTASGPFVAINCAAIPSELLESELFGVQARVATGVDPRPGLFAQADGGSIFLDEIGELAEPLQAKLLRVLQEREVLPLGAPAPRKINVRVIASSNRNLLERTEAGLFRADLYYRIRGLQFHIPPLRERREDIPAFVLAFVTGASEEHGKRLRGVSRKALKILTDHDWPGNVRELKSEIDRAVLVCPRGATLQAEHLGAVRWAVQRRLAATAEAPAPFVNTPLSLHDRIDALERESIASALHEARGNRSVAAKILGITRNGLAMKMRRLSITKPPTS